MSITQQRTAVFKAAYWYQEICDDKTLIHVGGRTNNNESIHVRVHGFTPFVYVELPPRIDWLKNNKYNAKLFFKYIKDTMRNNSPVGFEIQQKHILHYKKEVLTMFIIFNTEKATKILMRKLSNPRGIFVRGIGNFSNESFKVHESNIDSVIKMSALRKIKLSDWIKVKESVFDEDDGMSDAEERKFSTADIDMEASWKDLYPFNNSFEKIHVSPYYCSFDIECYSANHNSKLPNPDIRSNEVFQISMVFGFLGEKVEDRKKILLSLGNPRKENIGNCDELIVYNDEKSLMLGFANLIQRYNPDIFIGYNIMKFDWTYMIKRAELLEIYDKFSKLSRIEGKKADLREIRWSSSAYGEQKFSYLECHGRTNVDVLLEVERNYRLPKYTLDVVSEKFLGKRKEDVSARALFMLYQLTIEILPVVSSGNFDLATVKNQIKDIFPILKCNGQIKEYRRKLLGSNDSNIESICREAMEITGVYCVQDTILPIDLAEKLNLWTTMEEMSNVTNVPVSYLHTRGQQVKVLAQVFRETLNNNIIIPSLKRNENDEKFQGAIVVEAHEGDYEKVATLDFASLYPTIIIAFNICYTTILEDDDPTPDEECHVIAFSDHIGCEHDVQRRKRSKEDILCKDHRYRFRKIQYKFNEDGTITRKHEGLLPKLERNLLSERKVYKKEMFKIQARLKMHEGSATPDELRYYKKSGWEIIEKGSLSANEAKMTDITYNVLNAKQLAVKVSANSIYGSLGVRNGPVSLIKGAASVTAMGRRLITMAIDRIKKEYPSAKLVYGDSVASYTPIYIKHATTNKIDACTIDELANSYGESRWLVCKEEGRRTKEYCELRNILTWTDDGWTKLHRVIRHQLSKNKKMIRVITHTGIVDVTDDHSLLKKDGKPVSPKDVEIGMELLHHSIYSKKYNEECLNKFDESIIFNKRTQIEAANVCLTAQLMNYKISVDIVDEMYKIICIKSSKYSYSDKVKNIYNLEGYSGFVYDLTTDNHHFAAGVGNMVVHNTDSCMIHFEGKNLDESFDLSEEASDVTTHHLKCHICNVSETYKIKDKNIKLWKSTDFKNSEFSSLNYNDKCNILNYETCPIDLEFENMYGRFILLTKKRYVAHSVNRKGDLIGVTKKGVVLTRRDNSKYLRDSYQQITDGILDNASEEDVMMQLYKRIDMLFTRQIPASNLIIYMGIKSIINYAKSHKVKEGRVVVNQIPIDSNGDAITDIVGPLDPRLIYPNIPQVLLTLKMIKRGEEIPPNTRLEFIYIENPYAEHQGEKAEDFTYFKENRGYENLKPDFLHYIEKQLYKPVTELLTVKYKKEIIPYKSYEDQLNEHMLNIKDIHRVRIARKTYYEKSRPGDSIGNFTKYLFKKYMAQCTFIIDDVKYRDDDQSVKIDTYPELFKLALLWKSQDVIDKLHKKHGLTKRRWKKPTYVGEKLRTNTSVVVINDSELQNAKIGDIGSIIDCKEVKCEFSKTTKYFYDILFDDKKDIIEYNTSRNYITTFTYKDSTVMKDIFDYRTTYSKVVHDLKSLFSNIKFV